MPGCRLGANAPNLTPSASLTNSRGARGRGEGDLSHSCPFLARQNRGGQRGQRGAVFLDACTKPGISVVVVVVVFPGIWVFSQGVRPDLQAPIEIVQPAVESG